jgi:hypothetical protein
MSGNNGSDVAVVEADDFQEARTAMPRKAQ